jgi:hypothetical protein
MEKTPSPTRVYTATKAGMSQTPSGIKVTLHFNLDGDELDLVSLPLSGRVFITCRVDPDNVQDIRHRPEARQPSDGPAALQAPVGHMPLLDPVRHAAMLSRDPSFQAWVAKQSGKEDLAILPDKTREMYTGNWMRERLRIASRADLAVNLQARNRYDILLSEYRTDNPNDDPGPTAA